MKKIRVIQVGLGRMGYYWLKTVMASQEVEFAGFVEINDQIIEKRVKEYGLDRNIIFKSLPEALKKVKADGIIDVTPPQVHEEIALTSLGTGIPVLSEKPLADTIESARRIARKSNETGVLHMVAQNYRYSAAMQTLKKVIAEKKLGNPGAVYVNFFRRLPSQDILPYAHKLFSLLINDMSVHHFDAMRFLFESEPITIYSKVWNPCWSWLERNSSAIVVIEFKNNIKVSYNASFCFTGKETSWNGNWQVECEKGIISLKNDEVWISPMDKKPIKVKKEKLTYEGQAYLLHEFYLALTKGVKPATTCHDNIKTMNMVFDTIRSAKTGLPVKCKNL